MKNLVITVLFFLTLSFPAIGKINVTHNNPLYKEDKNHMNYLALCGGLSVAGFNSSLNLNIHVNKGWGCSVGLGSMFIVDNLLIETQQEKENSKNHIFREWSSSDGGPGFYLMVGPSYSYSLGKTVGSVQALMGLAKANRSSSLIVFSKDRTPLMLGYGLSYKHRFFTNRPCNLILGVDFLLHVVHTNIGIVYSW